MWHPLFQILICFGINLPPFEIRNWKKLVGWIQQINLRENDKGVMWELKLTALQEEYSRVGTETECLQEEWSRVTMLRQSVCISLDCNNLRKVLALSIN